MNVKTITANFQGKQFKVSVKMENEQNFNGNASGKLSWLKGAKIQTAYFNIVSDGANQFAEWADHQNLTEAMADHFSDVAKLMYDIQNSENLLESVRADLRDDFQSLSPEDVEELEKCTMDLLESTTEDRTELFTLRNI